MADTSFKANGNGRKVNLPVVRLRPAKWSKLSLLSKEALKAEVGALRNGIAGDPLLVRPLSKKCYEIVTGEIRWMAAKQAGLPLVTCEVQRMNDSEARKKLLLDALRRPDVPPLEEADMLSELIQEYGLRQSELAALTGRSKTQISRTIRISSLSKELKQKVRKTNGHLTRAQLIEAAEHPQLSDWIITDKPTLREIRIRLSELSPGEFPPGFGNRTGHSGRTMSASGISYDEFEDGSGFRLKIHFDQNNCGPELKQEIIQSLKVALFLLGELGLDDTVTGAKNQSRNS